MLSFSLVAEALTGLIYHRPSGENSNFQFKHFPEDERSFSRNVASVKNMIQDKTNCSSESIQHTESTNLNIFRITQGCIQEDRTRPRPKPTRQRSQGLANRQNEGEPCKKNKDHTANLKEKLKTNKNNISVAHINIDGLLHKMAEITIFLFTTKVDILAITETHLDLTIDREHIEIDGYGLERRDRQKNDNSSVRERDLAP